MATGTTKPVPSALNSSYQLKGNDAQKLQSSVASNKFPADQYEDGMQEYGEQSGAYAHDGADYEAGGDYSEGLYAEGENYGEEGYPAEDMDQEGYSQSTAYGYPPDGQYEQGQADQYGMDEQQYDEQQHYYPDENYTGTETDAKYKAEYASYSAKDGKYSAEGTAYNVKDSAYSVKDSAYSVKDSVYNVKDSVYNVKGAAYNVKDAAYSTKDAAYSTKDAAYNSEDAAYNADSVGYSAEGGDYPAEGMEAYDTGQYQGEGEYYEGEEGEYYGAEGEENYGEPVEGSEQYVGTGEYYEKETEKAGETVEESENIEEQKDGDDEDYEEDSDDDDSDEEDDSEDEDVNEALNSLGDIDSMLEEGATEEAMDDQPAEGEDSGPFEEPGEGQEQPTTSGEGQKKKRKRRKKDETPGEKKEKPKRKRKKKGEKSEDKAKKKADNARRNIRKILSENKLEKETLDAQQAEFERQQRLSDLKKTLQQQQLGQQPVVPEPEVKKEKDSQLKSLLQAAEEDAEKQTDETAKPEKVEDKKEVKRKDGNVIDISSGEDDDDVVMVRSEEEEEEEEEDEEMSDEDYAEAEDTNNSGGHINDVYNTADDKGRVLVNVGHPTADPDIFLSPHIAKCIKPHQIGGVRFLYDNLVECVNRFKTSSGFGCILAHSMGLGKTIQMIGFTDIFLRHTGARRVMVIVPINTLANWMAEFNMWVPDKQTCEQNHMSEADASPRPYEIYLLNDNFKNTPSRAKVVADWYQTGGVLLIGYEMYRLLSSKKVHLQKKGRAKKTPGSNVIDVEEEDRDKKLLLNVHEALVNPGPDLVVCDEGHRIKNSQAGISQSLKLIKTKRRIVLTGYPLQNNLIEYWCMVDFVRPNFLGTKTEFCNMFERPITNGQCADSTPQDVRLMRYRAHVLHSLLEGFVQRRGHTVLQAALPPKEEYVYLIRMSPIQKLLYNKFMESISDSGQNGWVNNNPLKAFSVCCKIWNHPDILYTIMKKSLDDNDLDIETGEVKKKGGGRAKSKKEPWPASAPGSVEGIPAMGPNTRASQNSGIAGSVPSPATSATSMGMAGIGVPAQGMTGVPAQGMTGANSGPQGMMGTSGMPQGMTGNSVPAQGMTGVGVPAQGMTGVPAQGMTGSSVPAQGMAGPSVGPQMIDANAPYVAASPGGMRGTASPSQVPNCVSNSTASPGPSFQSGRLTAEPSITYDWANEIMKDYIPGLVENGGKMVMLLRLIEESLRHGDKILVFSQSLFTLGLIEEFLSKYKVPRPGVDEYWCKNKNYYRLDGSTSSTEREKLINQFNYDPSKWVFLLSTRAGSLGVNLVGANRVIVMDASWNPCHDCQAICRVYRFGQRKPSFIYRLVTDNTMEKKIYDRQVNKQGMANRVVDELNPQNQFRKGDVDKIMAYVDKEFPVVDFSNCEEEYGVDPCMMSVLMNDGHWLTEKPFTHESLLIDRKELKLTMKEKRLAKQSYVMEKRLNVSYSRPSYAQYYDPKGKPYQGMIRGRGINRPIASVKPMVSTPVPMKPKIIAAPQVLKPGVSVHQVLTTTEIILPGTNTTTDAGVSEPKKIPAGQQVLVIRTPKGVYIRTPDGKIFAVRSKPLANSTSPLDTLANTGVGGTTTGAPTIVTTTLTGANRNSTGVTVIRPNVPSTTKPLTIIRSGPGQIRTVIPVTIGPKAAVTTTAAAKAPFFHSEKVNTLLKNGAQIRVVTPSTETKSQVTTLSALQGLNTGGSKVISNSPAFSGGSVVTKKLLPKPNAGVETIKNITLPVSKSSSVERKPSADLDSRIGSLLEGSDSSSDSMAEKTVISKSESWNLPPINMQALKLPTQLSDPVTDESAVTMKQNEPKKTLSSQSVGGNGVDGSTERSTSRPKFSLSESPSLSSMSDLSESQSPKVLPQSYPPIKPQPISDMALSTRPSDIDLHEMHLKSNPNSSVQLSQMQTESAEQSDQQRSFLSSTQTSQSSLGRHGPLSYPSNVPKTSYSMPAVNAAQPIQQQQQKQQKHQLSSQPLAKVAGAKSQPNRGIFNPGLPSASHSSSMMSKNSMAGLSSGNTSVSSGMLGNASVSGILGNSSVSGMMGNSSVSGMMGNTAASGLMMGGGSMINNTSSQLLGQNNQIGQDNFMNTGNANFLGNEFSGNLSSAMLNPNSNIGQGSTPQGLNTQQSLPGSQNKDSSLMGLADFGNLQNSSSFLSELNFSETDDNFLSQLDDNTSTSTSMSTDTAALPGSQMMFSNSNNMTGGSVQTMGRQIPQPGGFQPQSQMPGMGMDHNMFSNQQSSGFFPGFNNSQFQGNTGYGSNPSMGMSQHGGYPGSSMYPMGGMMQPNMYGYPGFAPYPYPAMMPPMPYYPMPFQPQYGAAQGSSVGGQQQPQQAGNIGMMMNPSQQGDNSLQTGTTNSGLGDSVGMH